MQSVLVGDHPGKAKIFFLPLCSFSSSDENCILSTLTFIIRQGEQRGFIKVVAFDQQRWKDMKILPQKDREVPSQRYQLE